MKLDQSKIEHFAYNGQLAEIVNNIRRLALQYLVLTFKAEPDNFDRRIDELADAFSFVDELRADE